MRDFNNYISSCDFSWLIDFILKNGVRKEYVKNQVFSKAHQIGTQIGYVTHGAFRYTAFSADATSHVVGFAFENSFVCDYASLWLQQPSEVQIDAVRHSEVFLIDISVLKQLLTNNAEVPEKMNHIAAVLYSEAYNRFISQYTQSAEEKYHELMMHYPNIFNHIPLKDIASYLRIRPETLSRIRKNIT